MDSWIHCLYVIGFLRSYKNAQSFFCTRGAHIEKPLLFGSFIGMSALVKRYLRHQNITAFKRAITYLLLFAHERYLF